MTIDPRQLLPRIGKLMEDQIALSRATTGQSILSESGSVLRVTELTNNGRPQAGNLLSGLAGALIPNRFKSNEKHSNLVAIQQASTKQKKFDEFVKFEAKTPQDFFVWRQKVRTFAMKMDNDVAGVWLMQLAERYLAAGEMELAAGSAEMLVTRWSGHAFAPSALWWLANYYASDEFGQIEFGRRVELGLINADGGVSATDSGNEFNTAPVLQQNGGGGELKWVPTNTPISKSQSTQPAEKPKTLSQTRAQFLKQRHSRAGHFFKLLARKDPDLVASPQFRMMDVHLAKRIQGAIANEARWQTIAKSDPLGIGIGAHRELILNGFEGVFGQTTPILNCDKTDTRPNLDGQLNDACWQQAIRSRSLVKSKIHLSDESQPASNPNVDQTLFSFDDEFLYVGIVCQKLPGHYYNARKSARIRDANLDRRDRVELTIDVDRDYRSAYKLVVDHRGWVGESCSGTNGWNPNWYVSQSENETSWTVEFAIPIDQLSSKQLEPTTVWAFGLKRRIFDDRDVWNQSADSSNKKVGLQVGLDANPNAFELIRFGNQAASLAQTKQPINKMPFESPAVIPASFTTPVQKTAPASPVQNNVVNRPPPGISKVQTRGNSNNSAPQNSKDIISGDSIPNFKLPDSWKQIPNLHK